MVSVLGEYLANSRLRLMTRHVILSGSFFDVGVKKLAIALPDTRPLSAIRRYAFYQRYLLVVVDSNLRFLRGGGDSDPSSLDAPILLRGLCLGNVRCHVRYNSHTIQ